MLTRVLCFRFLFSGNCHHTSTDQTYNLSDVHAGTISLSSAILTQKGQSGFRSGQVRSRDFPPLQLVGK